MSLTTTEERRIQRIAQLKAKLQKEEARMAENDKKKRDSLLFALGTLFESAIADMSPEHVKLWLQKAETLKKRQREIVRAAFSISQDLKQPNAPLSTPKE